ncbi:hypothetical protein AB0F50_30665, partial [Pseudonocardia alni]
RDTAAYAEPPVHDGPDPVADHGDTPPLLKHALRGHTSLSVALNGAALYLAISLSGLVGAAVITALDVGWLGVVAAVTAAVALVLSELAHRVGIRAEARAG